MSQILPKVFLLTHRNASGTRHGSRSENQRKHDVPRWAKSSYGQPQSMWPWWVIWVNWISEQDWNKCGENAPLASPSPAQATGSISTRHCAVFTNTPHRVLSKMCAVDFWPIKIDVFMGNVGKIMIQWRFFKGREDLGTSSSSGPSLLALSAAQPAPRLHCPGPVWVGCRWTKGGPRPIFKTWNFGDQTSKDAKLSKSFFSDVILIILTPCTKWFPDVDYTLRFESMGCLISTANPVCMVQRNCLSYDLEQMCKDSKWSK